MNVLIRKIRSFIELLDEPDKLLIALKRNFAHLRISTSTKKYFIYKSDFGPRLVCFPEEETSTRIYASGYHEKLEIEIAQKWLQPGDFCIDVGANVGLYSVVFSDRVSQDGLVLAFEPSPAVFRYLVLTRDILGLINMQPVASCVSDKDGMSAFYIASKNGSITEEQSIVVSEADKDKFDKISVPGCRLDNYCDRFARGRIPTLIKIDVEGAEPMVLEGARKYLDGNNPPLFIAEIHRKALSNYNYHVEDIINFFNKQRYSLYYIPRSLFDEGPDRLSGHIYPLKDIEYLPIYSNMIAVPSIGLFADRYGTVRNIIDNPGYIENFG